MSDTSAPTLVSHTLLPDSNTIDVSSRPVTLSALLNITDDLSGFSPDDNLDVYWFSPSGNQSVYFDNDDWFLTSGDSLDGTYKGFGTFFSNAEPGTWTLSIRATDNAGNSFD